MLTIPTKLYKHCYVLGRLKEYLKLKKKIERERERILFLRFFPRLIRNMT